jgi:peptide alpha-N-acetyltransferase
MEGKNSASLTGKNTTLFKQMLRFYDAKSFSKALKAADKILETAPDHGETLSMKGLIFYY